MTKVIRKIRATGTKERPRLRISITNKNVIAQVIDDTQGATLAYTNTADHSVPGNMTEKAVWAGKDIAKRAKKAKIKGVLFDRGDRRYHGRVKALADAAREEGLEF